jgi:hypothetical protein
MSDDPTYVLLYGLQSVRPVVPPRTSALQTTTYIHPKVQIIPLVLSDPKPKLSPPTKLLTPS